MDDIVDAINKLPEKLAQAAMEVLDHLFNKDLPKLVKELTAAGKALEEQAGEEVKEIVNDIAKRIRQIVQQIYDDAKSMEKDIDKDVNKIIDKINQDINNTLNDLMDRLMKGANDLLDKLQMVEKTLFCALNDFIDKFDRDIQNAWKQGDCLCTMQMLGEYPLEKQDCKCKSCKKILGKYWQCPCNPIRKFKAN